MRRYDEYQRQVEAGSITVGSFTNDEIGTDPLGWLQTQAAPGMKLLMHTEEIVLWGRYDGQRFVFPAQALYPHRPVRSFTIQSIRLFDTQQEIYLWQIGENQWQARTVIDHKERTDSAPENASAIRHRLDEELVLWGTRVAANGDGFCLLADGQQGLLHAPPLDLPLQDWSGKNQDEPRRDIRLKIRHYLEEDALTGWLRIVFSRLVDLYQFGDGSAQAGNQSHSTANQELRGIA